MLLITQGYGGSRERKPAESQPPPVLSVNDARDAWLYQLWYEGVDWATITRRLDKNDRGFAPIGESGVRKAVKRYADRFKKTFKYRQRGRRPRQK